MIKPLVSIIIPCCNQGKYLNEAINSIIHQSHQHLECIIVNDGSTDMTDEIALGWVACDLRIQYLKQKHKGVSSARNKGLKHAKGDFIQFLDADDLLQPEKIKDGLSEFQTKPDADIVVAGAMYFDDEPKKLRYGIFDDRPWMEEIWSSKVDIVSKMLVRNMMPICSPLLRSGIFKKTGYFNETMHACEDWEFWLRCAIQGMVYSYRVSPDSLALIRVHSSSASQNRAKMYGGELEVSIRVAPALTCSRDIQTNFTLGLYRLKKSNPNWLMRDLFRLIIASRNLAVLKPAIEFLPQMLRDRYKVLSIIKSKKFLGGFLNPNSSFQLSKDISGKVDRPELGFLSTSNGRKPFYQIAFFADKKSSDTVIFFAIDHADSLNDIKNYRVEINGPGIKASSIPQENRTTYSADKKGKLLWLQVIICKKITSFILCECILYKNSDVIGSKNISLGYKFRHRLNFWVKNFLTPLSNKILSVINLKAPPIVSLHLWHLDVAMEVLEVFQKTSHFFELRLAVPDNLDRSIPPNLVAHVQENHNFQKVSILSVPAVGRDIGGFISSLLHSMASPIDKNRLHLFLHTKNTPSLHPAFVKHWRESLIFDIINGVNLSMALVLLKFLRACIVYSRANDRIEDGSDQVDERKDSYHLARALSRDLFNKKHEKMRFCAGTMMWVMPARVEKVWSIEKLQAVLSKLEPSQTMQEPSYGHAFERLFPDSVRRSGLKVFTI
jgi:glycosyltransferase involved in cell wall biosynthesis